MTKLSEDIIKLRSEGKSYLQIKQELGCSKGTICYHLGNNQKEKSYTRGKKNRLFNINSIIGRKIVVFKTRIKRQSKNRILNQLKVSSILTKKLYKFKLRKNGMKEDYTVDDVVNKIGPNPKCFLTGEEIDLSKPSEYHFDHIIPVSKGGDNSLENLAICTKLANMSKGEMVIDEYLELCKKILINFGYTITK